jgi:hypothetical protein
MPEVGIFEFGDEEWVAAGTQQEAVDYFTKETGLDPAVEGIEVRRLDDATMARLQFRDDDGTVRTFAAQLARLMRAGQEFPIYFASGNA